MKKVLKSIKSRLALTIIVLAGLAIVFHPATVFAQAPGKKGKAQKPVMHGTLPEAEVTAKLTANLHQVDPHRVNVSLLNPTGKVVKFSIRNYSGDKVFEENFRGREFYRTFNFSHALSGTYSFNINSYKYSERKPFKIILTQHRTLVPEALITKNASEIMAAIYEIEPFKIRLHLANNSGKNVEFLVRNKDNDIVHRGFTRDAQFAKIFDISNLDAGKYTFEVNNRGEKISRTFDIKSSEERSFVWLDKRGNPVKPASTDYPSVRIYR